MKTLEKILAVAALLALLMKFFHLPGAGILLVLSLFTLAFVYFPLGFLLFKPGNGKLFYLPLFFAGWAFSMPVIGILFKFQYWPGAGNILFIGGAATLVMVAVLAIVMNKEQNNELKQAFRKTIFRGITLLFVAAFLLGIPSSTLIRIQHWDDPRQAELKIKCMESNWEGEACEEFENYKKEKEMNSYGR
jgi:hypothetical protein